TGGADHYDGFSYESACNTFSRASFDVEQVDRVTEAIFAPNGLLSAHDRSEFPPSLISRIESAGDAEVRYFAFKLSPSSPGENQISGTRNKAAKREKSSGRGTSDLATLRSLVEDWTQRTAA